MNKVEEKSAYAALPPDTAVQEKKHRVSSRIGQALQYKRKSYIKRMVFIPVITAVAFIVMVVLGHDYFTRHEFMRHVMLANSRIVEYKSQTGSLPSNSEFLNIDTNSRGVNINRMHYDEEMILDNSAPDTIMIYTSAVSLRFLRDGHVVGYVDGSVKWLSPDELQTQLEERRRFYLSHRIKQNLN